MMDYSDTFIRALKIAAIGAILVGGIGGYLTEIGPWYRSLKNPKWKPPDWAFGPIWTIILALVTIAAAIGWEAAPDDSARLAILVSFGVNAALNIAWNYFFFKRRRPDHALVEVVFLWLSILAMIMVLAPISAEAALFVAPYIVWVSIAALLNRRVVELNRPFGPNAERQDGPP